MYKSTNTSILLFIGSVIIGGIIGISIPPIIIDNIITPIATMLTRIMLYITIPYFIFSIIINSFELKKSRIFGSIVTKVMISGLILIIALTFISMMVFLLIPFNTSIPFIPNIKTESIVNFSTIIETLFPNNLLQVLNSTHTSMAAILIACSLIGCMAVNVISRGNVFFDVIDAIRNINLKILRLILPYFTIGIMFTSSVMISTIIRYESLALLVNLFIFLITLMLILLFIVYPFVLYILKVKISYRLWCAQVIPAVSTALATTNILASGSLLLHVEELGYSRKRINEMGTSLALVFSRAGTAVAFASSYLCIYKIYSVIPVDILFFLTVFVGAIITAYLSSTIISSLFITSIITLSQLPIINIQDLYIILIPVQMVIVGIGAGIDVLSCSFIQLFVVNTIRRPQYDEYGNIEKTDEVEINPLLSSSERSKDKASLIEEHGMGSSSDPLKQ